jgi:hypothetical protein
MGKRGPQPGFKKARAEAEASAALSSLSAADRENPDKLSGEPLRALAHRRGLARSTLADMPDEKIREQLRYITHRQYDDAVA